MSFLTALAGRAALRPVQQGKPVRGVLRLAPGPVNEAIVLLINGRSQVGEAWSRAAVITL